MLPKYSLLLDQTTFKKIPREKRENKLLRAILNKPRRQHPTKQQLYGHPPPITKTIKLRRTRHAGHCWRSKGELIIDILLWTPSHGRAKAGRPARTYILQLSADTGLVWFLCLMAYQPFYVIKCRSYYPRRTVVILFNP